MLAFGAGSAFAAVALLRLDFPALPLWLTGCLAILTFEAVLSWRFLASNSEQAGSALHRSIGPANAITLARGFLLALLGGFVLAPPRAGVESVIPAALYGANLLLDMIDGPVARATGTATVLGEVLEHELDSVGVVAAAALVVYSGVVGIWFLSVGVVRYVFLLALALRRSRGKPCHPIVYGRYGRLSAALLMGFLALALWPGAPHGLVAALALPVTIIFLAGFAYAWLEVTGRR